MMTLAVLGWFAACDDADEPGESSIEQESNPHGSSHPRSSSKKAKLKLQNASSWYSQTSTRPWVLSKTGGVDETSSTVTWDVSATQGSASSQRLVVHGRVTVRNQGHGGAPIGNVVVTLQSKSGSQWITRSSNVADATLGDAATSAKIVTGTNQVATISENAESGALTLTHASSNQQLPLTPPPTLPSGSQVAVKFTAVFNNSILNLPAGTKVRTQIIVTYGNAATGGGSAGNVDINGNGSIQPSEAKVTSESTCLGDKTVPHPANVDTPVTLSDTLADITTTGTVSFSNAMLNLGATSGTVRVTYAGGASGGSITNCAHLTGSGIDLEACDEQAIEPASFEWQDRDVVTYGQADWGAVPNGSNPPSMLTTPTPFATVYPTGLVAGVVGMPGRFSLVLTSGPATLTYLPNAGSPQALTSNHLDPMTTESGLFGGEVVGLAVNVDFADDDLTGASSPIVFGDIYVCDLPAPTVVNGTVVRDFLSVANTLLSGGTVPGITVGEATTLAAKLNASFLFGAVSQFARDHLSPVPCP